MTKAVLFPASASHPDSADEFAGVVLVEDETLRFQAVSGEVSLPLHEMEVAIVGKRFAFSNPQSEWTVYTADRGILENRILLHRNPIRLQIRDIQQRLDGRRRLLATFLFLALFGALSALAIPMGGWVVRFLVARIPASWEAKMGEEVMAEIGRTMKIVEDPKLEAELRTIAQLLAEPMPGKVPELRFYIVQNRDPNAFALPGGHVGVHTGLLSVAETPEELAGVLAHELAHVVERHGARQIISAVGPYYALRIFVSDKHSFLNAVSHSSRVLISQSFSREYEREADNEAWKYLVAANIDPRGLESSLRKMQDFENSLLGLGPDLKHLRSHPPTDERIAHLEKKWKSATQTTGFVDLKAKLKQAK